MHVPNGHWSGLLCLTLVLDDPVLGLNDFSHWHCSLDRLQPVHDQQVPRGAWQGAGRRGCVGYYDVDCGTCDSVLWCHCRSGPVHSVLLHRHAYAIDGHGGVPSCPWGVDLLTDPVACIAFTRRAQDRQPPCPIAVGRWGWPLLGGVLYEGDEESYEVVGSLNGGPPSDGGAFPTCRVDCGGPRYPASGPGIQTGIRDSGGGVPRLLRLVRPSRDSLRGRSRAIFQDTCSFGLGNMPGCRGCGRGRQCGSPPLQSLFVRLRN